MNCLKCQLSSPSTIAMPKFCVSCGHPMAQRSPWAPDTYTPLRDADGRPPVKCPKTGGLLKSCSECGRLAQIEETKCVTIDCQGVLMEATPDFPSPNGALDGTRVADWSTTFPRKFVVGALGDSDRIRLLAYRYGYLFGVTSNAFLTFQLQGQKWNRVGYAALPRPGDVTSMMVDAGRVTLCGRDGSHVVDIWDPVHPEVLGYPEPCSVQARNGHWWGRFERKGADRTRVVIQHLNDNRTNEVELPVDVTAVHAAVVGTELIVAAEGQLRIVNLETGQAGVLNAPTCRWLRVALRGKTYVALGIQENGRPYIHSGTLDNDVVGSRPLDDDDYLPDFVWVDNQIYLPTGNRIHVLRADQLGGAKRVIPLAEGQSTNAHILALRRETGEHFLLLIREQGRLLQALLLNPVTEAPTVVVEVMASLPRIVITDRGIVFASDEAAGTTLRTYLDGEGR